MATVDNVSRANIRIEIKNDFTEEMEVNEENSALSEGELEDEETNTTETEQQRNTTKNKIFFNPNAAANRKDNYWINNDGGFTTGVDIFGKEVQEKLQTRAQRFGLDPNECKSMTDQQLQELHESLGITEADEINTRFEAIHMYGTREMSTQDVFGYFGKYGPSSIEWINDESCNVVWFDRISAARAFHGLSSPIAGMPVKGPCNPFKEGEGEAEEEEEEATPKPERPSGRSILLINKTREVELYDESAESAMSDDTKEAETASKDVVHVSEIPIPVPPGYWRLGVSHPKAEYVLLRFAKRSDKKPMKAERFSEYYKKYGNPNYGGMKGLISESKKRRMKGFVKVEDEEQEQPNPAEEIVKGNPWGSLAKNWNNDVRETYAEATNVPNTSKPSTSILQRLGNTNKRPNEEDSNVTSTDSEKKSKVPRMRMYADEEEAKIEKAKQLRKIQTLEKIEEILFTNATKTNAIDLRARIGKQNIPKQGAEKFMKPIIVANLRLRSDGLDSTSLRERLQKVVPELSEDELNVQQRSKVTVIVKKANKPTMASTIWSRLDREKRLRQQTVKEEAPSDSENSLESDSSDACSDSEKLPPKKSKFPKAVSERPGFNRNNLKSRLGLNTEHKSPLRIEINNDHYKKS